MSSYLIVLFNLRDGVSVEAYERWAVSTDIPVVRSLASITGYDVFKTLNVRNADVPPPYQYVELIEIADMDEFGKNVSTDQMKAVAAEMRTFADSPLFILSEKLGG